MGEINKSACTRQTPTYVMNAKLDMEMEVIVEISGSELRKLEVTKGVHINYGLFMGDSGGGPIFDGPIGPKELSTSFIFISSQASW